MDDLKKNLGQLLFVGIASTSLKREEKKFLSDFNVGGVILFRRNYESLEQLIELTSEIKSLTKDKPFIGVDQEGGKVIRFGEPFTQFPSIDHLGRYYEKTRSLELVNEYAQVTADELKTCGLNLCFIPVMDVLTNRQNEVIGSRAFSGDPEIVSRLGSAVINVLNKKKVLSCAKHFPGHGDTLLDSHEVLPKVSFGLDLIMKRELFPFRKAVDENVPLIMTAHVLYESIDEKYPATLSENIITGILREKLGYENLVISDDLEMKGLSEHYETGDSAVRAVEAGVDILLVCRSMEKIIRVYEALEKEARRSSFNDKVLASLKRVERIKKEYNIGSSKVDVKIARKTFDEKKSGALIEKIKAFA